MIELNHKWKKKTKTTKQNGGKVKLYQTDFSYIQYRLNKLPQWIYRYLEYLQHVGEAGVWIKKPLYLLFTGYDLCAFRCNLCQLVSQSLI